MKYVVWAVLWLATLVTPALADDVTKEDVIKLARAGVGDSVIITFLDSRGARLVLSADDIVELKGAGVSDRVLVRLLEPAGSAPSRAAVGHSHRSVTGDDAPRTSYIPFPSRTYTPTYFVPYVDSSYLPYHHGYHYTGYGHYSGYGHHDYGYSHGLYHHGGHHRGHHGHH